MDSKFERYVIFDESKKEPMDWRPAALEDLLAALPRGARATWTRRACRSAARAALGRARPPADGPAFLNIFSRTWARTDDPRTRLLVSVALGDIALVRTDPTRTLWSLAAACPGAPVLVAFGPEALTISRGGRLEAEYRPLRRAPEAGS